MSSRGISEAYNGDEVFVRTIKEVTEYMLRTEEYFVHKSFLLFYVISLSEGN